MEPGHRPTRCVRCRMLPWHCFCDRIPRIDTATRVVLVMHQKELRKLSNTGRLVALALPRSEIVLHGRPGESAVCPDLADPTRQAYLLFPGDDAAPLSRAEIDADGRPVTLVVPDGTWRQARRMPRRVPGLAALPARRLPPGPPSRYRLRTAARAAHVSTCEAVARALSLVEDPAHGARLDALFAVAVERMLAARAGR